jgi:hypothetical protein
MSYIFACKVKAHKHAYMLARYQGPLVTLSHTNLPWAATFSDNSLLLSKLPPFWAIFYTQSYLCYFILLFVCTQLCKVQAQPSLLSDWPYLFIVFTPIANCQFHFCTCWPLIQQSCSPCYFSCSYLWHDILPFRQMPLVNKGVCLIMLGNSGWALACVNPQSPLLWYVVFMDFSAAAETTIVFRELELF